MGSNFTPSHWSRGTAWHSAKITKTWPKCSKLPLIVIVAPQKLYSESTNWNREFQICGRFWPLLLGHVIRGKRSDSVCSPAKVNPLSKNVQTFLDPRVCRCLNMSYTSDSKPSWSLSFSFLSPHNNGFMSWRFYDSICLYCFYYARITYNFQRRVTKCHTAQS